MPREKPWRERTREGLDHLTDTLHQEPRRCHTSVQAAQARLCHISLVSRQKHQDLGTAHIPPMVRSDCSQNPSIDSRLQVHALLLFGV